MKVLVRLKFYYSIRKKCASSFIGFVVRWGSRSSRKCSLGSLYLGRCGRSG